MTEGLAWPPTKEDLERMYLVEKLSAAKIAKAYGLKYANEKTAESTVLYHLKRKGITRRDKADHIRKVTSEMVDVWVGRYEAGESLTEIAGDEVDSVTVWNHLKKRNVVLRDKIEAQIAAVTKYERKPFTGDGVERAYLMGLRYGDLDVVRHGRSIRVRLSTTHQDMANLFESLFSPYGHVSRYPRESQFTGYEWTLECDLEDSFDFLLAKPNIGEIEALQEEEFRSFLAGFFDAEGTIYLHWKQSGYAPELYITNSNLELLSCLKERLEQLCFSPNLRKSRQKAGRLGGLPAGTIYRIHVWRIDEVARLLTLITLRHPEKVAKSRVVLELVKPLGLQEKLPIWKRWEELVIRIKQNRDAFVAQARKEWTLRRNRSVRLSKLVASK